MQRVRLAAQIAVRAWNLWPVPVVESPDTGSRQSGFICVTRLESRNAIAFRPSLRCARLAVAHAAVAQSATARVVRAANAFLATLDTAQRRRVMFAYDDDVQRRRWPNFPTGFVPRAGLNLREMSAPQRTATLALISTVLSARGYEKVQQIMQADEVSSTTAPPRFA
ncbi:MAG: DUF3500 domain-containing protein [Gemmatimonadaceae bacterium]